MPIRISDLRKATRPASFEWEGETCNLQYRPAAITMQMHMAAANLMLMNKDNETAPTDAPAVIRAHQVSQAETVVDAFEGYIEAMVALVAEWDVLGEDGAPLPITVETMSRLTRDFVYAMFGAIMAAYNPNARSARN